MPNIGSMYYPCLFSGFFRLLYEGNDTQLWHYPLMPNTNYFELIFPCPATIIKPSSETQKQKTKVKAKYKRQKRSQNQRIQEAQAAKERLKMFWSKKKE
ncbi:MAG: hypothetical protein SO129_04675, partial [Anaerovibrio sp.]|nr:hypothetical protein [Anaerovibrio sp.]